ncbi:HotDog domain-containing protein [Kalaharituber pfeilii]|nr:HotDog domain-containing protein [Kalaharituber pfeilii]
MTKRVPASVTSTTMSAPTPSSILKRRTPSDYKYHLSYLTRWSDNDQYAHLNNTTYPHLIDSIINTYLITYCSLPRNPTVPASTESTQIGLVVSSWCQYVSPASFPTTLLCGMRVNKLGKSSVDYEVGIFEEVGEDGGELPASGLRSGRDNAWEGKKGKMVVRAVGGFTHVFVDKVTRKVAEKGMQDVVRRGLQRVLAEGGSEGEKAKL